MLPSTSRPHTERSLRSKLIRAHAASLFALAPAVVILSGGSAPAAATSPARIDTDNHGGGNGGIGGGGGTGVGPSARPARTFALRVIASEPSRAVSTLRYLQLKLCPFEPIKRVWERCFGTIRPMCTSSISGSWHVDRRGIKTLRAADNRR